MPTYDPYDETTQVQSNQQQPTESDAPDPAVKSDQKKAVAAAAVGTVALGGAAYALSRLEDSENAEQANGNGYGDGNEIDPNGNGNDPNNQANNQTPPPADPGILPPPPIDQDPLGGLTGFDKAFAEARLAMGPGHTFVYEGETYNTYTKEEEATLTPDERNEFLASNNLLPTNHSQGGHHQEPGTAIASNDPDNFPEVTLENPGISGQQQADIDNPIGQTSAVSYNPTSANEPDISVIKFEGHDVALVDIDHDHEADIILADDGSVVLDTDGDHKYDVEGVYNSETHQIDNLHTLDQPLDTVAMVDNDSHNTYDNFDDLADFDNHADVSDFT